jgi:uncharacterized membrane protein YsdA (DUF1294 family)
MTYAFDKAAALRGEHRVPEATMHLLSVAGGWPGALLAQVAYRHKTVKRSFRSAFWFTVVANLGLLGWLATSNGQQWVG